MKAISKAMLLVIILTGQVFAESSTPRAIGVAGLRWISPPQVPGLQFTWVLGSENKSGLYLLRVKLASGARIPAHTHPDERNSTVLVGTLYVGFGKKFNESALVAIPAGDVYVVPAGVPHYLLAKVGEVIYQESGLGPTRTTIIDTPVVE